MLTGAVIAGATDLTYNLPGYIWVSICAVSTAVYLLLIRLLKEQTGGSSWQPPLCCVLMPQLLLPAYAAQWMHGTASHQAGASGQARWCCPAAGLNDTSMLLYNNLLSLPVMLSYMVMATDELLEVHRFPLLWDIKFQVRPEAKRVPATFCNPSLGCTSTVNSCRLPALPWAAVL